MHLSLLRSLTDPAISSRPHWSSTFATISFRIHGSATWSTTSWNCATLRCVASIRESVAIHHQRADRPACDCSIVFGAKWWKHVRDICRAIQWPACECVKICIIMKMWMRMPIRIRLSAMTVAWRVIVEPINDIASEICFQFSSLFDFLCVCKVWNTIWQSKYLWLWLFTYFT